MDREQLEAFIRRSLTRFLAIRGRTPVRQWTSVDNDFVHAMLTAADAHLATELPAVIERRRELDDAAAAQDGRARRRKTGAR